MASSERISDIVVGTGSRTDPDHERGAPQEPQSVASQMWRFARRMGVDVLFANLGSDHPAFIEAFATLEGEGPRIVVCPHEMTALSAAHGYAMVTRRPQMVLVHVDVGTANLGGSVHNAARSRVPAIIVAGRSPATLDGELAGSRTEFIHFIQDTPNQEDIVRPYVKWSYELREPTTTETVFRRGHQIASSEPQGPVYITGAREVWDKVAGVAQEDAAFWAPARLGGLPDGVALRIAEALSASKRPLVITTYLGRNLNAVAALIRLSEQVGIGVCEIAPVTVNFPGDHDSHLGYELNSHVGDADLLLLLDVDVPWLPLRTGPAKAARVFHIDCDPLKANFGLWHYPTEESLMADTAMAILEISVCLDETVPGRDGRMAWLKSVTRRREHMPDSAPLTEAVVARTLREMATDKTVFVVEDPSGTIPVWDGLSPKLPGSAYGNGGTALGWGLNAAVGAKLACPDTEVIAIVGDGAFVFGVPTSAFWVAHAYKTPFLTVICNNGGWNSPRLSTLLVHPRGVAVADDTFWCTMTHGAKLPEIAAAAGDAAAFRVNEPEKLRATLQEALEIVRSGRAAVVDVVVQPFSKQMLS